MKKSILSVVMFAVTAALLCAGCADNSEARPGGLVDRFLGAPLPPLPVYKVTFDSLGGGSIDPQEISEGGKVKKPADPTRYGHTFSYWCKSVRYDGGCENQWRFDSYIVTENITLYASWERNRYKIRFDGRYENGYHRVDSVYTSYGDTVLGCYTSYNGNSGYCYINSGGNRGGYTFGGWYIDDTTFTTEWDFSKSVVTSDTTLYAKWTINEYTVAFDSKEGSKVDSQYNIKHGGKVDKPEDPVREGYTFNGQWYCTYCKGSSSEQTWNFSEDTVTGNLTLYAYWGNRKTYTVTFISNGSEYKTGNCSYGIYHGNTISNNCVPSPSSRTGYTRDDGWYIDETFTTKWDFSKDVVTSDTTLYAKWTINTYKVAFNSEGGSKVDTQTVEYGGKVTKPDDPELESYIFSGSWYCTNCKGYTYQQTWNFSEDTITGNLTLYTQWIKSHKITFDAKGGEVDSDSTFGMTLANGRLAWLPTPARALYDFNGWFLTAAPPSTGSSIRDTAVTTNFYFNNYRTIYARWTGIPTPTKTTFEDKRGCGEGDDEDECKKEYQIVTIGTQTWMAENLNYRNTAGLEDKDTVGACYNNQKNNCDKYGRLYTWAEAVGGVAAGSSDNPSGIQGVCPAGWHLPSVAEWTALTEFVGLDAGKKLKSSSQTEGWYWNNYSDLGTDDYGFSALPAGGYFSNNTSSSCYGTTTYCGYWWSATASGSNNASYRYMQYNSHDVTSSSDYKTSSFSVRCVED